MTDTRIRIIGVDTKFEVPKAVCTLKVNQGFQIQLYKPKPNIWFRAWQWLLLGWKYQDIENQKCSYCDHGECMICNSKNNFKSNFKRSQND